MLPTIPFTLKHNWYLKCKIKKKIKDKKNSKDIKKNQKQTCTSIGMFLPLIVCYWQTAQTLQIEKIDTSVTIHFLCSIKNCISILYCKREIFSLI